MTISLERVENRILAIRGHRVILDADLAVQSNLKSQIVISNDGGGLRRSIPQAFTEPRIGFWVFRPLDNIPNMTYCRV
jgi:hypothetical protein